MSELIENKVTDFSPEEKTSLSEYIKKGCPGIEKIDENDVVECLKLYLSGKTYLEISNICKVKKDLVLYIAYRSNWHKKKMDYISDLSQNILNKVNQTKLESVNTLSALINAYSQKINNKVEKFITTNNPDHLDKKIDADITSYVKTLKALEGLTAIKNTSDGESNPLININISGNAAVGQNNDTIDISPKSNEELSKILLAMAEEKKKKHREDQKT